MLGGCNGSTGDTGDTQTTGDTATTDGETKADTDATTSAGSTSTTAGSGSESDSSATATTGTTAAATTSDTTADTTAATTTDGVTDSDSDTKTTGDSDSQTTVSTSDATTDATTGDNTTGDNTTGDEPNPLLDEPILWYSVDKALVYIRLNPEDGSVDKLVHNQLVPEVPLYHGQNGITVIDGGALLGSRESVQGTQIYYIEKPPITENTPAMAKYLGNIKADKGQSPPRIEALYTDCDGRVYLMDTGVDVSSAAGNRLLRFTGEYLKGDLSYEVITDLEKASVADIDDMSPGIVNNEVNDKLGFAIDSAVLWRLDYTTGTGMNLANTSGTWGVHALGGPLFKDNQARLYVLNQNAVLFRINLQNYSSSPALITGPNLMLQSGYNGWSGLAGPLTDCVTAIPQ